MEENIDEHDVEQSSATSSKRCKKSVVWEEFEKLPLSSDGKQRARCRVCKQDLIASSKGGTSSMLRHIVGHKQDSENALPPRSFPLDQEKFREKISTAIIKHNYPFSFVEHEGMIDLLRFLHPDVKPITRNTAKSDVLKLYDSEKVKLKKELESVGSRICLTSDLWTSIATDGYLALTAHYVDDSWVLQKRILSFRHVPPPHNGPVLAERVIHLLREWGIEKKVFSLTLDNASYNDGLVDRLKRNLFLTSTLFAEGEFFHIRCGAHILNLIVHDGLKEIDDSVHKVRESVKYVRGSEGRKIKFAECIAQVSQKGSKKVCQDVPTRWNSTYLMLESALTYRRAFYQLQFIDTSFKTCPSEEEWEKIEKISKFLKPFYDITTLFSGSQYPTSNLFFQGVWKIQILILERIGDSDDVIRCMAKEMKKKFDKYWECYSTVLSFAVILDPRYKLQFVEFCFKKLDRETHLEKVFIIREKLYSLYEEYVQHSTSVTSTSVGVVGSSRGSEEDLGEGDELDEFDSFESQQYDLNRHKSQLDLYLEENRIDRKENIDILSYWKANKIRYPELASMARDILSIPITTVASESSFSIGGQIVGKYRSSMLPKNVEALLCTRDWLYGTKAFDESEEELVEDFEGVIAGLDQC